MPRTRNESSAESHRSRSGCDSQALTNGSLSPRGSEREKTPEELEKAQQIIKKLQEQVATLKGKYVLVCLSMSRQRRHERRRMKPAHTSIHLQTGFDLLLTCAAILITLYLIICIFSVADVFRTSRGS